MGRYAQASAAPGVRRLAHAGVPPADWIAPHPLARAESRLDAGGARATAPPCDGKVTVQQVRAYVEDRVPEMTERFRGELQYPVTYSRGNGFPLLLPEG